jgi:putative ABC transport system permease protein
LGDADAIGDSFMAPSIVGVSPALQGSAEISFLGESKVTRVLGVTPDYSTVRNYKVSEGEFVNEAHMLGYSAVVILGVDVADALFGRTSGLVGETVRVEGQPFRVIGVLEKKGGSSFGSEDDQIIVPLTTAQTRLIKRSSRDVVDIILVQAISAESVPQAIDEISQILRSRHRTEIGKDDFTLFSQQDFLDFASSITGILTIFLGGVAAISLLVGGIGIMNIMLVSVIERTREIGLRKAMGARKIDILVQFLTESSLLSLLGGVLGIILGWSIAAVVGQIATANNADITPVIGLNDVLLATLFSAGVGLFFGLYPANRAAGLEPVEALRYE